MKKIIQFLIVISPWRIKKYILKTIYKYEIDDSCKIGYSWIFPEMLIMKQKSQIGNFNVAVNLQMMVLDEFSIISRENWITGAPTKNNKHFKHQKNRIGKLYLGKHSAITKKHHIDCTNSIYIGNFTTIAGYNSQLLTHSINLKENIQDSASINIGNYVFIGTNVVILSNTSIPDFSVLGAKSLLTVQFNEQWSLYGGVPASRIKQIDKTSKYFLRETGAVN